MGDAERHLLWTLGKTTALAAVSRIDGIRGRSRRSGMGLRLAALEALGDVPREVVNG